MKGRNPKTEGRKKAEGRRSNPEFGLRYSAFFRPSGFGLRVLPSSLCLLAALSSFAAATNPPGPDDIPPLRPPHAEMPPTFWEQHSLAIILLGAFLLALICVAVWLLARPKPPVAVPPEVQARQALEPLRQQPEDGLLLSRVSQILRRYVTAAFNLPPEELTTTEFCRAVTSNTHPGSELSAALSEFLRQCDQRKFSPPSPAPPLSAVAQALKLIDQAQIRLASLARPAPPPAGPPSSTPAKTAAEQ
jgi:hypothetical protein